MVFLIYNLKIDKNNISNNFKKTINWNVVMQGKNFLRSVMNHSKKVIAVLWI